MERGKFSAVEMQELPPFRKWMGDSYGIVSVFPSRMAVAVSLP